MSISAYIKELEQLEREKRTLSLRSSLSSQEERYYTQLTSESASLRCKIAAATGNVETRETRAKAEREELRSYLKTCPEVSKFALEQRTYNPLVEPSGLVPEAFFRELLTGVAQYTPLFDKNVIRLVETGDARPMTVPAVDLSTASATIIGQAQDNAPAEGNNPVAASYSLGSFTYRSNPVAASIELEQDSFESISQILTQFFQVGLARKIGSDMILGDGSTAPLGLANAAADSTITTATSGIVAAEDIRQIYFKLNRAYRVSPQCVWILHDTIYQQLLGQVDTAGRPLINVTEDKETMFGKKIIISPDMPTTSGSKAILFGDLSQYICRVNRASVRVTRSLQAAGYAELGMALYTAWIALDAKLNVVNGVKPVIYGTLQ